jgi:hypothetical protein
MTNFVLLASASLRRSAVAWIACGGIAVAQGTPTYPTYPWQQNPGQTSSPLQQPQWQGPAQATPNPQLQPGMPELSPWDPRSVRAPTLNDVPGQPPTSFNNLFPTWTRPEAFQGFPVFPPSLGSYMTYPAGPGGTMQLPDAGGQLPPPEPPLAPDWPTWIKAKRPGSLPYEPTVAVVVRQADRVWWRPDADEAFVPLYHYDNARALSAGSELEVRHSGEFLLLLHGGTRISSFGTAKVGIQALSEKDAALALADFSWVQVRASARALRLALPDGSDLFIDEPKDVAQGGTGMGPAGVRIERRIEPGRYSGRATIFNFGSRMVRWVHPLGEVTLQPGCRVTMFLDPCDGAIGEPLVETNVAALADGGKRVWQAPEDGKVTWSGARFELPRGAQLVLDPLLGDPFGRRAVVGSGGKP